MDNSQHSDSKSLSGNALIAVFLFFALALWIFGDILTFVVVIVLIGSAFVAYYNADHADSH